MFEPTDAAFNDAGITVDNVGEFDAETLVEILTYRVIPGRRYTASVVNAPYVPH